MIRLKTILRKRWVLAVIFLGSFCYFAYHMTQGQREQIIKDRNLLQTREKSAYEMENILRMLKWHSPSAPLGNSSRDHEEETTCRNSKQGREVVADDFGYVCMRDELNKQGCCEKNTSIRYMCDSCSNNNCCALYEHCVSCCLKPDKRQLLENLIREAVDSIQKMVYASVRDQFELCLSKCRTSSLSVQHENKYKDSKQKHCFGTLSPEMHIALPERNVK